MARALAERQPICVPVRHQFARFFIGRRHLSRTISSNCSMGNLFRFISQQRSARSPWKCAPLQQQQQQHLCISENNLLLAAPNLGLRTRRLRRDILGTRRELSQIPSHWLSPAALAASLRRPSVDHQERRGQIPAANWRPLVQSRAHLHAIGPYLMGRVSLAKRPSTCLRQLSAIACDKITGPSACRRARIKIS